MVGLEVAQVTPGGITGDRYARGAGTWSGGPPEGRALTLVAAEDLEAAAAAAGVPVPPAAVRRNLVLRGVPVAGLVGSTVRIGEIVVRCVRPADPCRVLAGHGVPDPVVVLAGRAGVRADVLVPGRIAVGDPVEWTGPPAPG